MGAVFQVRDLRSGRSVALKRLRERPGTSARLWFEREYFTLSELAHPRIIEVYDYGIDGEGAYYTMELLDGADLRERKNLSVEQVCALALRHRVFAGDPAQSRDFCTATCRRAT